MKPRHKRMIFATIAVIGLAIAAALVITALRSNISYFFSPSQVLAKEAPPAGEVFRLGGMVREGSLKKSADSLKIEFVVTDNVADVRVRYDGILPDLFKEGQGTVTKGRMGEDGAFYAEEVLAKHDEAYMPPEVTEAMKNAPVRYQKSDQNQQPGASQQ